MQDLTLLTYPDERLKQKALPITVFNENTQALLTAMRTKMYTAQGIGLAATQVNVHQQIAVVDVSENQNQPLYLVNPQIIDHAGEVLSTEGCLSVPNCYDKVKRFEYIKVTALNHQGDPFELEAEGLLAICIQHELDHLKGTLFIDHLSQLKRDRVAKKMAKQNKQASKKTPSVGQ